MADSLPKPAEQAVKIAQMIETAGVLEHELPIGRSAN